MDGAKIMTKKTIDCSQTQHYLAEKSRMAKRRKAVYAVSLTVY